LVNPPTMLRIGVLCIGQETNDFNPSCTTLRDFLSFGMLDGQEMFARLSDSECEVGGYLAAAAASPRAITSVPIFRAWGVAGGRISAECLLLFKAKVRDGLRAAGALDGLALLMHGACAAEGGVDDVEGALLAEARAVLGAAFPIVVSLDHHGNLTDAVVRLSTAIVGHRTQPHLPFETGRLAAELLFRVAAREVTPVMAWRKLRMITHQEQFLTCAGPMKVWFDRARAAEAAHGGRVLHASPFPMQPWLDVAEGGWSVVVTTDGDAALAERLADELADLAWSLRSDFLVRDALPVDDAVRAARAASAAAGGGLVLLSDTGDTVFGGAAGDSNLLLEAMLRLPQPGSGAGGGGGGRALVPLIEPTTALALVAAGAGATLTLPVGGSVAAAFFKPLTVTGTVRAVGGGLVPSGTPRFGDVDMGAVAVFDVGCVTLLVSELRGVAGNTPGVYRAFGVEPRDYAVAVVKTASNFQFFAEITDRVVRADTTGPGQSQVETLPWARVPRPIWPLEPVATWRHAGAGGGLGGLGAAGGAGGVDAAVARLRALTVAVVGDVLDRLGFTEQVIHHGVRPAVPGAPPAKFAGRAFPVLAVRDTSVRAQPYAGELAAIDAIPAGAVVMLATGGACDAAVWGGLLSSRAVARGAAAAVTDGAVRDLAEIRALPLPVYAAAVCARDAANRLFVTGHGAAVAVTLGGVRVAAGDLVLGDEDGVVVVPAAAAGDALDAAERKAGLEREAAVALASGVSAADMYATLGIL
jgi:microcystin degradation protein MlrC/regulator of RNase E activity RraA